jgi:hypothetical protein
MISNYFLQYKGISKEGRDIAEFLLPFDSFEDSSNFLITTYGLEDQNPDYTLLALNLFRIAKVRVFDDLDAVRLVAINNNPIDEANDPFLPKCSKPIKIEALYASLPCAPKSEAVAIQFTIQARSSLDKLPKVVALGVNITDAVDLCLLIDTVILANNPDFLASILGTNLEPGSAYVVGVNNLSIDLKYTREFTDLIASFYTGFNDTIFSNFLMVIELIKEKSAKFKHMSQGDIFDLVKITFKATHASKPKQIVFNEGAQAQPDTTTYFDLMLYKVFHDGPFCFPSVKHRVRITKPNLYAFVRNALINSDMGWMRKTGLLPNEVNEGPFTSVKVCAVNEKTIPPLLVSSFLADVEKIMYHSGRLNPNSFYTKFLEVVESYSTKLSPVKEVDIKEKVERSVEWETSTKNNISFARKESVLETLLRKEFERLEQEVPIMQSYIRTLLDQSINVSERVAEELEVKYGKVCTEVVKTAPGSDLAGVHHELSVSNLLDILCILNKG